MMCMTELHGGVCHRTSTPHKSGNKMKEKKKICMYVQYKLYLTGKAWLQSNLPQGRLVSKKVSIFTEKQFIMI